MSSTLSNFQTEIYIVNVVSKISLLFRVNIPYGLATPERKRKRFRSRNRGKMAKSLLLGVPGKLDDIRNQWSDIAFALVLLYHKGANHPMYNIAISNDTSITTGIIDSC